MIRIIEASQPRYALSQELEIRNQEFLGRDERLLVRASRRLPLPEAGKERTTFRLSVGTARRAVRGGFGETALPVATWLQYDKKTALWTKGNRA